ncbi:MAG: cadherin repeat domain-containing protein [bacterium]
MPVSDAIADYRPRFVDCPHGTVYGLPCETIRAQVRAVSQRWPGQAGGMRFKLVEGPGTINASTGEWMFAPTLADLGRTQLVEIVAADGNGATYGSENCRFLVTVSSHYQSPTLVRMRNATINWSETYTADTYAWDECLPHGCETLTFSAFAPIPKSPAVEVIQTSQNTADISWTPGGSNIGIHLICVNVQDACGQAVITCADVRVYNRPPLFDRDCFDGIGIVWGETAVGTMTAEDPDYGPEPLTYSVISFDGLGMVDVDPATGEWEWITSAEEQYVGTFRLCLQVTDNANIDPACSPRNADTCCTDITVVSTYRISVEQTKGSYQGQHEYVDVTIEDGFCELGGFDLLLAYDRAALNFQTVMAGPLFDSCPDGCGWEYFNFRTWFWPTYEPHFFWAGIIHIIGMAELNNGAAIHPCCFMMDDPVVLFTIDFLVTDNRLFECQFAPVRFFWTCMSSNKSDTLLLKLRHTLPHCNGFSV